MSRTVRCHFIFPTSGNDQSVKIKVVEEMGESLFNVQVPIELL